MDPSGLPNFQREQEQWFYRRSGMMMRSPFMLNTDWYDPSLFRMARAELRGRSGKGSGFTDDRVRLALARATLREGKSVADWNIALKSRQKQPGIEAGKMCSSARNLR